MIQIKEVKDYENKKIVIEKIVADLPEWFGDGSKIADIERMSGSFENMLVFAAYDEEEPVGFISLKQPTPTAVEIGDMGVLKSTRGKGVGKMLVMHCENYGRERNIPYMTVKTIDESGNIPCFEGTRAFYRALKFVPVDVIPQIWGPEFPCLFYVKAL